VRGEEEKEKKKGENKIQKKSNLIYYTLHTIAIPLSVCPVLLGAKKEVPSRITAGLNGWSLEFIHPFKILLITSILSIKEHRDIINGSFFLMHLFYPRCLNNYQLIVGILYLLPNPEVGKNE
jgi:hypothetical protein